MFRYSDNFYERQCFLKQEQVPTQSVMKKKMTPALAQVYFKSMTPKLKILAGLEPPMKGGGADWYIPPKGLLKGELKFKPEKNEYLKQLGFNGINAFGDVIVAEYKKKLEEEKIKALLDSDAKWKAEILKICKLHWEDTSRQCQQLNTQRIQLAFQQFATLYKTSITDIESVLFDAAIKEIKRVKQEAYDKMVQNYRTTLKEQAMMLSKRYDEKLQIKKAELKAKFINQVEEARTAMSAQIHDINVEKHRAIEKVRNFLQCQNMACQVYVALKEREECKKEIDLSRHEHKKKVKTLDEQIMMQSFEIKLLKEKEKKRQEFYELWRKKICHVIKRFQIFVEYCLTQFPDHAQFFIDMEKLMLLQIEKSLNDSKSESIFVSETPEYRTVPEPQPHPFFLYREKKDKVKVEKQLCPVHCTSSASVMPVVVINKRCIYAACDNLEISPEKIREYLSGHRGDDLDFKDSHDFDRDVPIKFTRSDQLRELKLESSLMQVLQEELPNPNNLPLTCCICQVPYCFCSPLEAKEMPKEPKVPETIPSIPSIPSGTKICKRVELKHDRQPKIESYLDYVKPKKCGCPKIAKKHLQQHLPPYMQSTSVFEDFELPQYERCSVDTIKRLVRKAMHKKPPPPPPLKVESTTRNISTQYSDPKFESICDCLSDDELSKLLEQLARGMSDQNRDIMGFESDQNFFNKSPSSFASDRALSLRRLLDDDPQLEEIFKKCK